MDAAGSAYVTGYTESTDYPTQSPFQTDQGEVAGPTLTVQPGSRETVDVSETVETYEVSTKVVSDQSVIAERAVYYNDRQCAHDSIGN